MKCEKCHGIGQYRVWDEIDPHGMRWEPCWDCHGSGITHCCDGLCEQPSGGDSAAGKLGRVLSGAGGVLSDKK